MRLYWAMAPLLITALTGGGAAAATVGTITFDDNAWADGVRLISGFGDGVPAHPADGNTSSIFNLVGGNENAKIEILFTDNLLRNGDGDDLVLFYGSNNNALSVTINDVTKSTNGRSFDFIANGGVGNNSGFSIIATKFDLDEFNIAAGATLSGGIFLEAGGIVGAVNDVAALNSTAVPDATVVPLPATLPLLAGGLAMIAAMRRWSA